MGEGKTQEAGENFTLIVITGFLTGLLITVIGLARIDDILYGLGASDLLFPYCKDYLTLLFIFAPAAVLQTIFQNLFVTAGKPELGFWLAILAGVANVVLDYLFIVPLHMGIRGAALGTGIGYLIPTLAGIIFFARSKGSLSFRIPKPDFKMLMESCYNGSSEMTTQLAMAITTFLFNITMMKMLGEDGVAAITIIIYSQFMLSTLFIGYSIGVAPVIGFNYGSQNSRRQRNVFKISLGFITVTSAVVFLISYFCGPMIVKLFAVRGSKVYLLAEHGFRLFSFGFLFCGFNIFTTAAFTALSNGKISALLSFLRTFGFVGAGLLIMPHFWGVTGVWLAIPVAELIMFFLSALSLIRFRKRYGYF